MAMRMIAGRGGVARLQAAVPRVTGATVPSAGHRTSALAQLRSMRGGWLSAQVWRFELENIFCSFCLQFILVYCMEANASL